MAPVAGILTQAPLYVEPSANENSPSPVTGSSGTGAASITSGGGSFFDLALGACTADAKDRRFGQRARQRRNACSSSSKRALRPPCRRNRHPLRPLPLRETLTSDLNTMGIPAQCIGALRSVAPGTFGAPSFRARARLDLHMHHRRHRGCGVQPCRSVMTM